MKCWQTSLNSNKNSLNNNNYICTMTMIIIMWFLLSILFCCRNRSAFNHNANCIKQIQRYKNNTDHRSAARGPLPPLLSIIRTGNEPCGRGNTQFFLHWKQGTAIFWAVWVAVVCLCICVCVSCCFHPEACAVCQRPAEGHVPRCGVVPLWFSEPTHVFMVYCKAIFTLLLWQKPPRKHRLITPKLKEVDNTQQF